jgi:hypothetical protein
MSVVSETLRDLICLHATLEHDEKLPRTVTLATALIVSNSFVLVLMPASTALTLMRKQ